MGYKILELVANIQMFNILSLLFNGIPNIGGRKRNVSKCYKYSSIVLIYRALLLGFLKSAIIVLIIGGTPVHIILLVNHLRFEANTMFAFIQRWFSTVIQCSLWHPIPQIGA